jgi:hypothetical protein
MNRKPARSIVGMSATVRKAQPLDKPSNVVIIATHPVRYFRVDVSLPGVQNLLRIVAEAQRVIDANERVVRAA